MVIAAVLLLNETHEHEHLHHWLRSRDGLPTLMTTDTIRTNTRKGPRQGIRMHIGTRNSCMSISTCPTHIIDTARHAKTRVLSAMTRPVALPHPAATMAA